MIITGFLCWSGLLVVCLVGKGGGNSGLQVWGVGGAGVGAGVTEGGVMASSLKPAPPDEEVTLAWLQRKSGGGI